MILIWLIYIGAIIASAAFAVLYKDMLSLILFIVIVLMPVLMLLCGLIVRLFTRVTAEIKDGVINNGDTAIIKIAVKNYSPFPASVIDIAIRCENKFLNVSSVLKTTVSAKAFSSQEFVFSVKSDHIGKMGITAKKAVLHDPFKLFAFPQKLKASATVTFIPKINPVGLTLRNNTYALGESDIFSKHKAGDDPSEVFDIRDYRGGDKLNRIHWKLSVKQNKYMVKDYSLPINESLLIFADLSVDDNTSLSKIDAQFEALMSIAFELVSQEKMFFIGWYDEKHKKFKSEKIESLEDVYLALSEIFSCHIGKDYPSFLASNLVSHIFLSHIAAFSSRPAKDLSGEFVSFNVGRVLKSVVVADDSDLAEADSTVDDILIYPVHTKSVATDLINIVL